MENVAFVNPLTDQTAVNNIEQASAAELNELVKMEQRTLQFRQKYQGQEISGMTFANMSNNTFEEVYLEDITRNNQFPWEYYNGVFMNVKYEHVHMADNLSDLRIKVVAIEFGGTFSIDN